MSSVLNRDSLLNTLWFIVNFGSVHICSYLLEEWVLEDVAICISHFVIVFAQLAKSFIILFNLIVHVPPYHNW